MMSCPGALPFLGSNLTMVMSSFGSTTATSRWLSSLSSLPSLVESSGVYIYGLAYTNWLISLRFVSSKLLHSIPKCLSTDSARSSAQIVILILPVKPEIVKRSFIVSLHRGLSNSKEIVLAYTECRVVEKVKLQPQEQAKSQDQ